MRTAVLGIAADGRQHSTAEDTMMHECLKTELFSCFLPDTVLHALTITILIHLSFPVVAFPSVAHLPSL